MEKRIIQPDRLTEIIISRFSDKEKADFEHFIQQISDLHSSKESIHSTPFAFDGDSESYTYAPHQS